MLCGALPKSLSTGGACPHSSGTLSSSILSGSWPDPANRRAGLGQTQGNSNVPIDEALTPCKGSGELLISCSCCLLIANIYCLRLKAFQGVKFPFVHLIETEKSRRPLLTIIPHSSRSSPCLCPLGTPVLSPCSPHLVLHTALKYWAASPGVSP